MRKYVIVAMAALAVAACGKKGADADGDGKITTKEAQAEIANGGKMAMKPGMWEVTMSFTSIEGKGLPAGMADAMKAKVSTSKMCMTKEQVEKPGSDFFGAPASANCSFSELNRSGDSMKVAMTCKPDGKMTLNSTMEGTFGAESYTLNIEQKMQGMPVGDVTMKGKMDGKRVGDCPT